MIKALQLFHARWRLRQKTWVGDEDSVTAPTVRAAAFLNYEISEVRCGAGLSTGPNRGRIVEQRLCKCIRLAFLRGSKYQ